MLICSYTSFDFNCEYLWLEGKNPFLTHSEKMKGNCISFSSIIIHRVSQEYFLKINIFCEMPCMEFWQPACNWNEDYVDAYLCGDDIKFLQVLQQKMRRLSVSTTNQFINSLMNDQSQVMKLTSFSTLDCIFPLDCTIKQSFIKVIRI